jgi:hypothetical protein
VEIKMSNEKPEYRKANFEEFAEAMPVAAAHLVGDTYALAKYHRTRWCSSRRPDPNEVRSPVATGDFEDFTRIDNVQCDEWGNPVHGKPTEQTDADIVQGR